MLPLVLAGGAGLVAARILMGRDQVKECVSLLAEYEPATSSASGPVYRNVCALKGFPTLEGVETLYELFAQSVQRFADNPCLGTRLSVRHMLLYRSTVNQEELLVTRLCGQSAMPMPLLVPYG